MSVQLGNVTGELLPGSTHKRGPAKGSNLTGVDGELSHRGEGCNANGGGRVREGRENDSGGR